MKNNNVVAVNINGSSVNVTTNESVTVESNNKKHSDIKSVEKIEKTRFVSCGDCVCCQLGD